jgi:gliding motility-associated-like protein
MLKTITLGLFMLLSIAVMGQEVCDNGIDDDGDGLVDLNDPECECTGIYLFTDQTDKVPNANLDDMDCCPSNFSEMNCASFWQQGNTATTDYMNTCGWVLPAANDLGLVPFPSGSGAVGMVFSQSWSEYLSGCLNAPLDPGIDYTLSFQIAVAPIFNAGTTCNGGIPPFGAADFTLYGNPTCSNLTVGGTGCPSGADPTWVVLGSVSVSPIVGWVNYSISFTPTTTISAIMVGPPCNLPPEFGGQPCYAYFMIDDLQLAGEDIVDEIEITPLGLPCTFAYSLEAFVDDEGGTFQWYFNGVALSGQNDPNFPLSENGYQSGNYQVTYTTDDGCVMETINITIPPIDTVEVDVFYCPETSVSCGGETYYEPGVYEVILVTPEGCDSVVTCIVTEYDLVPVTELEIDTCGPFEVSICGESVDYTGFFEFTCSDYRGCDSIVTLDLRIMNPEVVLDPPDQLACDPTAEVTILGTKSPINPLPDGTTYYEWTGPSDGFVSDIYDFYVVVNKPGQYCLTIIFENNGVICSDTACVTVTTSSELPAAPEIQGPGGGCIGDVLSFNFTNPGSVPASASEWILPGGANIVIINDSTIQYVLDQPGTVDICAVLFNECGSSDTTCISVSTASLDAFQFDEFTCDSAQVGIFQQDLVNQFGCDSIVVTTVTLAPSQFIELNEFSCFLADVGVVTNNLTNQFGCDSIIQVTTSLLPSDVITQTFYTCDSSEAGLDTLFLTNQSGCDSTVYQTFIFSEVYQQTDISNICGNGTNYIDTIVVNTGTCDSLFITDYIYYPLDSIWIPASTCDPSQVGITTTVLTASTGCDSTILVETTLSPSSSTLLEEVTCDISQAGTNILNLQNQYGCDSIVTIVTEYVGVDTIFTQDFTCDIQLAGIFTQIVPGINCDTVKVTETLFVPGSVTQLQEIRCGELGGPPADTLIYNDQNGCDSMVTITYTDIYIQTEIFSQSEGCAGDGDGVITITQVNGGNGPYEYQLSGSAIWQNSTEFSSLLPGEYTLFIRDANGCADTITDILISEGTSLSIDAGPDLVVDFGDEATLSATTTAPLTELTWNAIDSIFCSTCPITQIGPLYENQMVTITGQTANGCLDEDMLQIVVRKLIEVYIPNSFSPNYDGINDIFSIYGNRFVAAVRNLAIYDRWGNSLYYKEDLPINNPSEGWDGHFRGKIMDPGVYVYVVEVELTDGSVRLYKGDVTLVR